MKPGMWDSFQDELVATGLVLAVAVTGTFWFTHTVLAPPSKREEGPPPTPTQTVAQQAMADMVKVLGEKSADESPTPIITHTVSPPAPTISTEDSQGEVLYGVGGLYENEEYRMEINSPRLVIEENRNNSRKFVVDMILYNKAVETGLTNKITAAIIKDGTVIVPDAAMSLSETNVIKPGEKLTFQAKLSLIESTDVKEIHFKPLGFTPIIHQLLP